MNVNAFLNADIREVTSGPSFDKRWGQSLSLSLDEEILGKTIVAYQVQWFSGTWSKWYMPGEGDVYQKAYEPKRRFWACFYDHAHRYMYQEISASETEQNKEANTASKTSKIEKPTIRRGGIPKNPYA